jgi:hypothetical protein
MAARCVGIANVASQAGKAPRHRGQAPSGREEVGVSVDQMVAVAAVAAVISVVAAEAAAVWGVMGAVGGEDDAVNGT